MLREEDQPEISRASSDLRGGTGVALRPSIFRNRPSIVALNFRGPFMRPAMVAIIITLSLLLVVLLSGPPVWETNDDIGMALISGGRGLATERSASILFSNVIYGWVISRFPDLFGLASYDLISYSLDILAIGTISYATLILSENLVLTIAIAVIIS